MKQQNIFVIGGSGLVGSQASHILEKTYKITSLSTSTGVDITNPQSLRVIVDASDSNILIHFAAKTDVDSCEEDRLLGENGDAWKINVQGVKNIVDVCRKAKMKLIYISTDFVFDGMKSVDDAYQEDDVAHPINWYGETKYQGEQLVLRSNIPFIIARIAYPYGGSHSKKLDFATVVKTRLGNGQNVSAVTDHIFTPTYIDDVAYALDLLIKKQADGIFHVVGSELLTPYHAAIQIADMFGYDRTLVTPVARADYFSGRAARPFNLSLKNDKIQLLGIQMRSFTSGLNELKE
ncbi:MAG TPA: NAD(P)-dependent oxidoreductase [Patescibacteria group bacterium]|nr:NAD(P)-dependent oxidoreductase [Patescibacteria group bacterium]